MSNRIGIWARRGVCASALAAALLATAACSVPNPFQQTTLNTDWAYSDRGGADQFESPTTAAADDHPYEVSITKTEVVSDPEHGERSDSPVQVQLPKVPGSKDLLIDQKVDVR